MADMAAVEDYARQTEENPTSGALRKQIGRLRFNFFAFLVMAFLLSAGLALSVAFLSLDGIVIPAGLNASQPTEASATMTYLAASLLSALFAAFALIFALGRRLVLAPQIALRQSRERLRESEAEARRLALVAEKATDIVIIYDRYGHINWVNAAFVKTTGFLIDEVIGRRPGEFLYGERSDTTTSLRIEEAMRQGEPVTAQIVNYSKSGREYLVEVNVSPVRDANGDVTNFIAVERDISERHVAERRLREAVELLEDGFTIYDRENRLVLFNRAFEEMLGVEGILRKGMTLAEVGVLLQQAGLVAIGAETAEEWACEQSRQMRSGEIGRSFVSAGDRTLYIRDLETETGEVVSLRTDVTDLHEARRKAEEAVEAKSRFFANITHEVRTPLNGVIAMAELLLEDDLTEPQRSGLQLISQSGSSLLQIINDLLDHSKLEAGKLTIQPAPFDVVEAIEDVVALLAPEAHKRNNELAFRFDPSLPRLIKGDHGRVRQIATNLIGNAIKFTTGGEIAVRLGGDVVDADIDLLLEVEDSGVGISEDSLERIFQPFEQTNTAMLQAGAGLGLSICRQIAGLMDGDLSATSAPDEGSTFRFAASFPVLDRASTVSAVLRDVAPVALHGAGVEVEGLAAQVSALGGRIASYGDLPSLNIVSLTRDGRLPMAPEAIGDAPGIVVAPQGAPAPSGLAEVFPRGVRLLRRPVRTAILTSNIAALLGGDAAGKATFVERRRRPRGPDRPLVLVAEDNATNAAIIRAMLADQNMQVVIHPDGGSAVEAYERNPPAVVLMDIHLPDMTGYEATARMRALDEMQQRAPTPIIAATASSRPEDQQACRDAGLDDFISKPLNKQQLCAKLSYWIMQREGADDVDARLFAS